MHDETKTIKINEEIQRKYQKIEQKLPQYDNARTLFEGLVTQMAEEFAIPYIWLAWTDQEELSGLIDTLGQSPLLKDRIRVLGTSSFSEIFENRDASLLINEDLRPFYRLQPAHMKFFIRSLAIAPIKINNHLIGSLNCGDASAFRYQPGMDTSLLDHLAAQVANRLAEVMDFGKMTDPAPEDTQETHEG